MKKLSVVINRKVRCFFLFKWTKDLSRPFSREDIQIVHRRLKSWSTSLIIRETLMKTTMRYHLISVSITIIINKARDNCWQGCGEKGTLVHFW